jgi:uncharacterized protein YpmB
MKKKIGKMSVMLCVVMVATAFTVAVPMITRHETMEETEKILSASTKLIQTSWLKSRCIKARG